MTIKKQERDTLFLYETKVENIFINEYMTGAPGEFVKIFLVASMYAEANLPIADEDIAKILSISDEEVKKAWAYWESIGVVQRVEGKIRIKRLKENLFGKKPKTTTKEALKKTNNLVANQDLKSMYRGVEKTIGRTLSGTETTEILSWIEDYEASPEIIVYAYGYAAQKKKSSIRYVGTIVKSWVGQGITNVLELEKMLAENDQRHYTYKRVMKALGFSRNATEEEKRIINSWVEEMGFSIEEILDACKKTSGISNPNINYINKVLTNWNKEEEVKQKAKSEGPKITPAVMQSYYKYLREKAEDEAKQKRSEIHKNFKEISQLEGKIREYGARIATVMISNTPNKQEEIKTLRNDIFDMEMEIKRKLTQEGLPVDYLETKYKCSLCGDTGTDDDGQQCICYPKRIIEAEEWLKTKN